MATRIIHGLLAIVFYILGLSNFVGFTPSVLTALVR